MTSNKEMVAESKNDVQDSFTSTDTEIKRTKKKKGLLSRLWGAIFRLRGDDFEKRLQYLSKEEAAVLSRIVRRSHSWRRMNSHLIIFSVLLEAMAVGYAIMTTRSVDLNWKMRALRVLPMFMLPGLSFLTYFSLRSFRRLFDLKDHKTLERLRAERQTKIDELKEKTNYYTTQQLIQKYDPDPAAKAAAATVLASKLGADSGLKVYVGDASEKNDPVKSSNVVEVGRTGGLHNRKQSSLVQNSTNQNSSTRRADQEEMLEGGADVSQQRQMVVEHHPQAGLTIYGGGWIARLAALLVGEDPTQSYALICGNCHMHNGLAWKEDFQYVTYYCPHCNALNRRRQPDPDRFSGGNSPAMTSTLEDTDVTPSASGGTADTISASGATIAAPAASEMSGS